MAARHGTTPYGEDVEALLEQARRVRVGRPTPHHSNFGFELLGHALARAAGLGYPELVRQRLVEPLGLSTLYAPTTAEGLQPTALGRPQSARQAAGALDRGCDRIGRRATGVDHRHWPA